MSKWDVLDHELARWRKSGREAELWWRDDDAADAGPALERLLDLRRRVDVPLALAIVPAHATATLAERLAVEPGVDLLQHGYAHANHAPSADKKSELDLHRPAMIVLGELGAGWLAMERLFGGRPLRVLVPPWNRIAPGLIPALPEVGYTGVSTFGARGRIEPVKGLRQVNTHLDVIDWHGTGGFVGHEAALERLVAALAAARSAVARSDEPEPIGILSHHLAMDEAAWDFLSLLLQRTRNAQGVKMPAAHQLFASREARV